MSFVEIGHEIISMAILSLSLIQVEQLSVTDQTMCTKYCVTLYLGGLSFPRNSVGSLTDHAQHDLISDDWAITPQLNQSSYLNTYPSTGLE